MSIETEITRLNNAKQSIKTAIENKGVTVGDDVKLDGYAELIDSIEVGSGETGGCNHVNGDFYMLRTNGGTDFSNLFHEYKVYGMNLDLTSYDTSQVTTMFCTFYGCSLKSLDISNWNTSKVKNMRGTFNMCDVDTLDISSFNTINVTNMAEMFGFSSAKNIIFGDNFNTSNVTHMSHMFNSCDDYMTGERTFNFDTSKVTNMDSMFKSCKNLTSLDISSFDTSNVTNMDSIFKDCTSLVTIQGEIDCTNLSRGLFYMSSYNPFYNCKALETVYLKNIYKNVDLASLSTSNKAKMSIDLSPTVVNDECLIYIINELPNLADKGVTSNTNIKLTLPTTNTLTAEQKQVATDKGWIVVN